MTRTEQQLTTVLHQVARGVRDETLAPLVVPSRRLRHRLPWLAPLAAATAVVLVAVVAVIVSRQTTQPGAQGGPVPAAPGPAITASAPPKYYVDLEYVDQVFVRATATGAVTAQLRSCGDAIAAAADNTTFYTECFIGSKAGIYSFRLTSAGKVTGLAQVPGGQDISIAASVITVSPDGGQIAISGEIPHFFGLTPAPRIIVINTRTGTRATWSGGLARSGAQLTIASLSWTRGGRSLVFLANWCSPLAETLDACVGTTKGPGHYDAQVWALNPATGGGRLNSGRLVLSQSARFPYIAQALISADGTTIVAAVMVGPENRNSGLPSDLSIVRISVATGRLDAVTYQAQVGEPVTMSADGSGDYLLVAAGGGRSHGWVHAGHNHPVPPYTGDGQEMAW